VNSLPLVIKKLVYKFVFKLITNETNLETNFFGS